MINIYLDDVRPCPEGFVLAKTPEECMNLLRDNEVNILSLDHDIDFNLSRKTGYDVAMYIIHKNKYPDIIYLHTSNPVGRDNMYRLLKVNAPLHIEIYPWAMRLK